MCRQKLYKYIIFTLVALTVPITAAAQNIVKVGVDTIACLGDTVPVSIGFQYEREIVVQNGVATLGSHERAFLPDGVVCDGTCSYESPVVFTDFPVGATINSAEDILYIRINIEHSFLGDIYMGVRCPNGQRASLMNWSGSGHSACTDSVPSNHRGWSTSYANAAGGTYLGMPVDYTDATYLCDSTLYNNRPGVGWNYCWSNNTSRGYQYANDDGLIYRASNRIFVGMQAHVDSSNVAAGTNFYHPNHNFSNLIGCPLNGRWSIEVIDAYSQDNGYIFEWSMALDPELLPTNNIITGQSLIGSNVTVYNDSTFGVSAPPDVTTDTVLPYYVYIFTNQGDTADTMFRVHYYAPIHIEAKDTICQGDTAWWIGHAFTTDTMVNINTTTVYGCDSTIHLNLKVNPVYDTVDTLAFCPFSPFIYEGVDYGGPRAVDTMLHSVLGCDSLVHATLLVIDSGFAPTMLISDDGLLWSGDTAFHGCQPLEIYMLDTTHGESLRQWMPGDSTTIYTDSLAYHLYDTTGVFTVSLRVVSLNGCYDTTLSMPDAVHVYPNPMADFGWDNQMMVIHDAATKFINLSLPDTIDFLWEFTRADGGTDTSTEFAPYYQWASQNKLADEGDYDVTLVAIWTNVYDDTLTLLCTDTVTQSIHIINDFLKFPNLVTPNGDGKNDIWKVVNLLECGVYTINELWIFNQWGQQVYHVENISRDEDFWDPNATSSPNGTYYYRFAARNKYGVVKRNGAIELLRGE